MALKFQVHIVVTIMGQLKTILYLNIQRPMSYTRGCATKYTEHSHFDRIISTTLNTHDSITGTTLIAAVNCTRNCVTIKNNGLQYIWVKVRTVKAIGESSKTSDDTRSAEVRKAKPNSIEQNEPEHDSVDDDESGNEQIEEQ